MESEEIMHCAKTQVCQLQWKNDHSFFYLTVFSILLSSYSILPSDCYDCYLQDLLIKLVFTALGGALRTGLF